MKEIQLDFAEGFWCHICDSFIEGLWSQSDHLEVGHDAKVTGISSNKKYYIASKQRVIR